MACLFLILFCEFNDTLSGGMHYAKTKMEFEYHLHI